MKKTIILSALALACVSAGAQELKEGYIVWGTSSDKMGQTITDWQPGQTLSEDDHFFISRIKPKARFRNVATQVRQNITESNDKKLIAWLPVNDEAKNALPDGVFDSEVFTMWPYVTHWGNWTAPLGRVPGAFLNVAHKNGVPVSGWLLHPSDADDDLTRWGGGGNCECDNNKQQNARGRAAPQQT